MKHYSIDLEKITEERRVKLIALLQSKGEVLYPGGFILSPIKRALPYRYLVYDHNDKRWCGGNGTSTSTVISIEDFLLKHMIQFKEL